MAKILTTAFMRDLEAQVTQGIITYSRMLELIEEKVLEGYIYNIDLESFREFSPHFLSKYLMVLGWEIVPCMNDYKCVWVNSALNKSIIAKVNHLEYDTPFGIEVIHTIWSYDGIYNEGGDKTTNISPMDFIDL